MTKSFSEIDSEIIAALDVQAEYAAMGVRFSGRSRASGIISCHAIDREDHNASAWVNTHTGRYGDSGDPSSHSLSLWDFAAARGGYADWRAARAHFAAKAGIPLGTTHSPHRWRERLQFQSWEEPGNLVLAERWCLRAKQGVTVESIRAAGGMMAYYPCYIDKKTGEHKRLHHHVQVIALPAFGEQLLDGDPVAWVIWDSTGAKLELPKQKKTDESRYSKMISIGPTAGAMMGSDGLSRLSDPERRAEIKLAWKTAGPSDMLALWSRIPPELRPLHVVVTNAGSETADVSIANARLFAGLVVAVIHDADRAGEHGAEKWCRALQGVAAEIRHVRLPYDILENHGHDVRDYLGT